MEFIDKKTIKIDKEINELDKFIFKFLDILKKYSDYVIVSGYVAIFFGRSRGTEDIDILVPKMNKEKFFEFYDDLIDDGFWCLNHMEKEELYSYLDDHAIRFALSDEIIPNMEFKIIKNKIDEICLNNSIKIIINEHELKMSNLELQIAYKEEILGSDKDLEDARHLKKVFKDKLDDKKIENYRIILKNVG